MKKEDLTKLVEILFLLLLLFIKIYIQLDDGFITQYFSCSAIFKCIFMIRIAGKERERERWKRQRERIR